MLAAPGLLVVDEATSSLDPATEARIMMLLADQARAGTTVIAVTHHLDNVDQADKLLILGHGEVVWFGSRVEALGHFGVYRLADVYLAIEDKPAGYWGTRWRERQAEDRLLADAETDPQLVGAADASAESAAIVFELATSSRNATDSTRVVSSHTPSLRNARYAASPLAELRQLAVASVAVRRGALGEGTPPFFEGKGGFGKKRSFLLTTRHHPL